jgi:hypothetical protein
MLTKAVGRFNTDPTEWNVVKTAPGEYQTGIAYIMDFNRRVGTGQAKITDDAKSLASFLRDYVSNDLGGASAILEPIILQPSDVTENARTFMSPEAKRRLSSNWGYFDTNATEPFFLTKGKLYAYYNILMAVGTDYEARLKERGAWDNWQNMLMSLRVGASMDRFFVANGEKDDTFTPQHVAVMGFSLLRADKQIREIAAIMEK